MIRVRTLGQCSIQIDTMHVGPDAEMVFASLLLLTVERGRRVGRGELLGILWPYTPASRASHCLRQTIYRLRTLGTPLEVTRTHLTLPSSVVDSDVDALLRASRTDDIEHLADRVSGPFLPGYSPTFSEPLRDWVERQRDLVSAGARRVLVGAISVRKSRGEWADVERLAHQCLAIDPLNEDATLALAEAAALHGGKVEAMGILDRYLREMGPTARELRLPAIALRRRIAEPELEFPLAPPLHVPFVGRSAEMATLATALRSARGGAGSVHFIHGEPGIGKTRLLNEFTRAATLEGVRVAPALCQSSDSRRPLSAFVDVVPKLMTMPGALGCSPESHRYLRRLVEHHSSEAPPTPDASEAALLFANVRRSLFDLVDAIASETPLLITIEDVHWLDPASWEIVIEAAPWIDTRRMMLILTSRDREHHCPSVIAASPKTLRSLWLGPIDLSARERLFEATLRDSGHPITEPFRTWCVEMSGGNPYYLRELALHGLDARGQFEIPPSLTTLVSQRVARLRPVSCRVLQACAILGKNATLDRIEAVLDQPQMDLLDAYDELEQAGLLAWANGNVVCHHDLLVEAALDRASRTVSSYLHRKAAMTLAQSLRRDCQVSLAWDCAKHLLSAGEPSQAAAQLMDCARHALELGRPFEADEILAGSLELPLSATERTSVLNERAHALRAADRWGDVVAVLSEIVATQSKDGRIQHTDHELQLVYAKWAAGSDANCLLSSLRDCCRQHVSTSTHRLLAARWAFMLADNICEAEIAHDIYRLVSADLCSDSAADFDRTYCHMVYNAAFGDITEAEQAARQLGSVLQDRSDIREVCLARTHVAEVLKEAGHVKESVALLEEAYRVAVANSLLWLACLAGRRLAWRSIYGGDYRTAAEWVQALLPISERIQHVASRADVLGAAAELALHKGELAEAAELLNRSAAVWKDTQHARSEAFWMASQTAIWLAEGNLTACQDALPRFMELYRLVWRHADQDQTTARLVRVLEFTNQFECAEGLLREYVWTHRRGRAPLSVELAAICERKGVPLPASLKEQGRSQAPAA
jgi:DNA-binding SARP family transcriptional activator